MLKTQAEIGFVCLEKISINDDLNTSTRCIGNEIKLIPEQKHEGSSVIPKN